MIGPMLRLEQHRAEEDLMGRNQAIKDFANASASNLDENLPTAKNLPSTLELLLQGTRKWILHDRPLLNQIGSEGRELDNLIAWVRSRLS